MAIDFLIDGAKSLGQIASDASQNIFNGMTKNNIPLNKVGNLATQGMMTSGPPRRSSRRGRKKAVAKPI